MKLLLIHLESPGDLTAFKCNHPTGLHLGLVMEKHLIVNELPSGGCLFWVLVPVSDELSSVLTCRMLKV